ncbi:MAG: M2 family metallopeptidase [Planctomycetota bacterium]|jgi:peptidyl-dipeptidase A
MRRLVIVLFVISIVLAGCKRTEDLEEELKAFVDSHVAQVKPISKSAAIAYWDAANSGKEKDYEKASQLEYELREIYTHKEDYDFLKNMKQRGGFKNALLSRQLNHLYNAYLSNQIDPELLKNIVDLSTKIQKDFSTFRGEIEGEKVTDNQIKEILKKDLDTIYRRKTWLASKQVGGVVSEDLISLVKLRNEAARKVGFENFHTMSLVTAEQEVEELDKIFDELYELTNEPYARVKGDLDEILAVKYGVDVSALGPWHYHDPFFQETPLVYEINLDIYYENKDIKELAERFYDGIGLEVDSILANSDLYEREGKNPHAFCTDVNREGDVRILCNLKDTEQWMETMLHELGHGVYGKYNNPEVPYLLREPAHIFTTEAIAMFFGRLSRQPFWMQEMLGLSNEERMEIEAVSEKYAQLKQLIFVRWAMVMYHFEKELYRNPDQDLNTLWWDMVEKYQLVKRPEGRDKPDWAAKIHFTIAPCYYHNYVLGELLASQLYNQIVMEVLKLDSDDGVSYVGESQVGIFLRENVFEVGSVYHWNEMIEKATGEGLTAKYFVAQFVK